MKFSDIATALRLKLRPPNGFYLWLFPGVPLAICVATLTAIGPNLQLYALSAINSTAPTIYSAAYEDNIASFTSFGEWIFYPGNIIFLLIGSFCAFLSLRSSKIRDISSTCACLVAIFLSVGDVIGGVISQKLTLSSAATDIIANLVGGILVGVIVFVALGMARKVNSASLTNLSNKAVQSLAIVGTGFVVAVVSYYSFFFLYQPVPVQIDVVASAPLSGFVVTKSSHVPKSENGPPRPISTNFQFTPPSGMIAKLSIQNPARSFRLGWFPSENIRSDVSMRIYKNCAFLDAAKLPAGPATIQFDGTRVLRVSADNGGTYLQTDRKARFALGTREKESPSMFWLDRGDKQSGPKFTSFTTGKDFIKVDVDSRGIGLSITPVLMSFHKKKSTMVSRTITLSDGVSKTDLRFVPTNPSVEAVKKCSLIAPIDRGSTLKDRSQTIVIPAAGLGITALLRVGAGVKIDPMSEGSSSRLLMTNLNGWVSGEKIDVASIYPGDLGSTPFLSFQGALRDLEIDAAPSASRPYDSFVAQGLISGQYEKGGQIHLKGTAEALWKNGKRMNPTKWERSSTEVQIFLIASMFAIILGIWRVVWPAALLHKDDQFY